MTETIGSVDGGRLTSLVNTQNIATTIGLEIKSRFNGANTNGTIDSAIFAPNATRDSLYGNTETWNSLTDITPSFKLTGLDPLLVYDFTFYASRMGVGNKRETGYTVTGAKSGFAALNPSANEHRFVTVTGIEPDGEGQITIDLAPTANNVNSYHFTYLGVLKIEPKLPVN